MKCPICGNEKLIKVDPPLYSNDCGAIKSDSCFACVECGYVIFKSKDAAVKYKRIQEQIKVIDSNIATYKEWIKKAEQSSYDMEPHKRELAKWQKRLAMLDELGIDNKERRAALECIADEQAIITKGVDESNLHSISFFQSEIKKLEEEKKNLENSIYTIH